MKFGTGQSWEAQSTPQMKMQAAKEFANPPPAIVQAAHTFEFYMKAIETCDLMHDQERSRLIKQLKESGTWKDKYDSWEAVSELVLGMTARHSNRLIASVSGDSGHTCPESTDKMTRAELKALKQVEKSREIPEKDEEDERPAVKAATPEQMKRKPDPAPEPLSAKPPMDASGAIIPQHLLAMRERRDEITALETAASKLRALFERLQTDPDMIYGHILASGNVQHFERSASSIRHNLAECLPDIVCPRCEGSQNGKPCEYCCGSGWIAEVRWNREWVKSNGSMEKAYVAKRAKNL